jgi:hypothetical protein
LNGTSSCVNPWSTTRYDETSAGGALNETTPVASETFTACLNSNETPHSGVLHHGTAQAIIGKNNSAIAGLMHQYVAGAY